MCYLVLKATAFLNEALSCKLLQSDSLRFFVEEFVSVMLMMLSSLS